MSVSSGIILHLVVKAQLDSLERRTTCMGNTIRRKPGRRLRKLDLIGRHGIRENTIQKRLKRK